MIKGPEHTAIASENAQELANWYVQHLDFTAHSNSGRTVMLKAPNGYMIEIITAEGQRVPHKMKDPGMCHLAIAVDEFDEVYERLKAAGTRFDGEPFVSHGNRVVFFTDPEGNYLHLICRSTPL